MSSPIAFDQNGLIVAVAQDRLTGQVRMVAWMDREALRRTLDTGLATFFSRARNVIWQKGETTGNVLKVQSIYADCDADTLLLLVDPEGPSCHTGRPTCFFRRVLSSQVLEEEPMEASAFLQRLEHELERRAESTAEASYTKALLDGGASKIGDKIREEAEEFAVAISDESANEVAHEAADTLYHVLVGLRLRGVPVRRVIEVLAARAGVSGHQEKARRSGRS